jgi:hypothetical protein
MLACLLPMVRVGGSAAGPMMDATVVVYSILTEKFKMRKACMPPCLSLLAFGFSSLAWVVATGGDGTMVGRIRNKCEL